MFPYFQKLNIRTVSSDGLLLDATKMPVLKYYDAAQKHALRARKQFDNYVAIPNATYVPREEDAQALLQHLPKELVEIEMPDLWAMNIRPQHRANVLPAHRDMTRLASVTFFFDTHGEETSFYEYEGANLVKVASFVANSGDVYLINNDKVHDVRLAHPHIRKSLGFSFVTTPFETVYDQLRKAELISGHELP